MEDVHEDACIQVSTPEGANASPRSWLCALSHSLHFVQSPLFSPTSFSHLLLSACFLHTGILRNAWGAPGFASPARLPCAEPSLWLRALQHGHHKLVMHLQGASGAPMDLGSLPTIPPLHPSGLVKQHPGVTWGQGLLWYD